MSESNFAQILASEPQSRLVILRVQGNTTTVFTKVFGSGITLTRTGVGVHRLTFNSFNGKPIGVIGFNFEDATMSVPKGFTVTSQAWASATNSIDISVWDSTFAAKDLAVTTFMNLLLLFKTTNA